MEDKTQLSNSESSDKSEKTVVMSSGQKSENSTPKEQEKGSEGGAKQEKVQMDTSQNNPNSKSSEEFLRDSKSKKSVVPIVVAGAAAAVASGVAGVALGATYSEDIKEVVGNPFEAEETLTSSDDVPLAEASTSPEDPVLAEPVSIDAENTADTLSSLEISGTDQDGNVYSVSFLDFDGDGEYDIQTSEFQTVDGLTVSYTEYGNSLDSLFTNDFLLAENTDYVDCGYCGVQEVSMMDSYLYEIQPGDTLSEIAAANNTSVEHLMELNPQISNPDLIYAGNNLILPDGDQMDDTFQNTDQGDFTFIAQESTFVDDSTQESFFVDDSAEGSYFVDDSLDSPSFVDESVAVSSENFDSIDWSSFYDNPVENPYTSELDSMDFQAMETPQSYNESDYGMGDFSIDESGLGFF